MKLTKRELKKIILEERANVIKEKREFSRKTSLICEIVIEQGHDARNMGYTLHEANDIMMEGFMDMAMKFLGPGAQFDALKDNIIEYIIDLIGKKVFKVSDETIENGLIYCAIREALVRLDFKNITKYFGPEKCKELSSLIIGAFNECWNEKFIKKIAGDVFGFGTQGMFYEQIEEVLKNALQDSYLEVLEKKLADMLCGIDFSKIFGQLMSSAKNIFGAAKEGAKEGLENA